MSNLTRHFKLGMKVARAHLLKQRSPFFVQLAPTSRCNLNCKYCFAQFHERDGVSFPRAELMRVIDGLARLGTRFIMVTGGEPMMYPHIVELIERISSHGIEVLLNTNGFQVVQRMEELSKVDIFSVSMDGPPEIHDFYRGEGTYEIALKVVQAARARGKRVQLQFTMTRDLMKAFQHVNSVARELGCFIGINFLRPQNTASGEIVAPGEVTEEEIKNFLDWMIDNKPVTVPYPVSLLNYVRHWPYPFSHHIIMKKVELRGFHPIPCQAGRFLVAIDSQGNIYPCTKWFFTEFISGNCADGDIERAWRELKPKECQACLDLGANLLNDNLRFSPSSLLGLIKAFQRK